MSINLEDPHRQAWLHLVGKRVKFRGTVARFGHKHRQGRNIKRGATLLLVNVHRVGSPMTVDHAWINYTADLATFGEHLRPNGIIEFTAIVGAYEKGGKNSKTGEVFDDLELTQLKDFRIVTEPYWPVSYEPLQGNELVSYVIKTRQNTKTGKVLGYDPQNKLGLIHVGQGFANKFAKTLSWRWGNLLPEKYRFNERNKS